MEGKMSENEARESMVPGAAWRIKTGFAIFIVSIVWPVLLPILTMLGFSTKALAAFTGVMVVVAEIMMILGAIIAGKDGFAYIKKRVFGFLKSYGPPRVVSPARYRVGLVTFLLPLLYAFLSPYVGQYIPGMAEHGVVYAVVGDVFLLVGLFLLGGEFWDKLRALFVHKAVAVMPGKPAK